MLVKGATDVLATHGAGLSIAGDFFIMTVQNTYTCKSVEVDRNVRRYPTMVETSLNIS